MSITQKIPINNYKGRVTAPSDADCTSEEYLANAPFV